MRSSSTKLLPAGAVLLTSRATIGFTAVAAAPICTNQGFVNFICGPDLLPEFLAYWLRTQKPKMLQHAGGTTFKEIARGTLRKFEIVLPEIETQHRIVDLLTRAEGIVRLRREAQQKASELIPAIFIDMFGDPATNPRGLPLRSVRELVARFEGGINLQAGSEGSTDFRILKVSAVTSGEYIESESKPTPSGYEPPQGHVVRDGDMLFSRANTKELVGATAIVRATNGRTLLPDKLWRFVWAEPVEQAFMLALFQSSHMRQALGALSSGTSASMRNISQAKLFELRLPIPSLEEQRVFARRADVARSILSRQEVAFAKATASFDALLSRAFG
jgi:type I restriction enzyme S subunit